MKPESFAGKIRRRTRETFDRWWKTDCSTQAAAISYFAALSLFPFVIVLISGVGLFFEYFETGQSAAETVLATFAELFSPEMSGSLATVLQGVQTEARIGGPIALVILLYLATRSFAQIDQAFLKIWEVDTRSKRGIRASARRLLSNRLRSLVLLVGYGLVVILVFFGGTALVAAESLLKIWFPDMAPVWSLNSYLLSLGVNTLVFGSVYRFLSRGPVRWKWCLGTGLLVAALWEIGRIVLAAFLIGESFSALGLVGSFLGILVWIFYNTLALLAGAILVRVIAEEDVPG